MKRQEKLGKLQSVLESMGSVLLAYSGGADSAFLLKIARETLGDNVLPVTAVSVFFPEFELQQARKCAAFVGSAHKTAVFRPDSRVWENSRQRCYYCKRSMMVLFLRIARSRGIAQVIDGSTVDDTFDFRPGKKALRELKIRSPFVEAGLAKRDIREISRLKGMPTWNKASFSCLATGIPFGEKITVKKIRMLESGEAHLRGLRMSGMRIRLRGSVACVETRRQEDMYKLFAHHRKISGSLRRKGFSSVCVALDGYHRNP